jgi:hypothetical protein
MAAECQPERKPVIGSMKTIADQLPPEIAKQLHPARRKNEAEYWAVRDRLLTQYDGQWVGFADGKVVASGISPVTVFHAAEATGLYPFFICVGREEQPCRIRRATFAYDGNYPGEALPVLDVEFRRNSGASGIVFDRVIPDTGADASVLPWPDCQVLQLTPNVGSQTLISGVVGATSATLAFQIWAFLDGREYPCRIQADFAGTERILGRDVLNRLDLLFCGPSSEIVVNP